jgi:chromosome segregation ATPase
MKTTLNELKSALKSAESDLAAAKKYTPEDKKNIELLEDSVFVAQYNLRNYKLNNN